MQKFKSIVGKAVAVVGGSLVTGAAMAQATLPASVTDAIDDTVDLVNLAGWALFALVMAVLAFRYIRRVMR